MKKVFALVLVLVVALSAMSVASFATFGWYPYGFSFGGGSCTTGSSCPTWGGSSGTTCEFEWTVPTFDEPYELNTFNIFPGDKILARCYYNWFTQEWEEMSIPVDDFEAYRWNIVVKEGKDVIEYAKFVKKDDGYVLEIKAKDNPTSTETKPFKIELTSKSKTSGETHTMYVKGTVGYLEAVKDWDLIISDDGENATVQMGYGSKVVNFPDSVKHILVNYYEGGAQFEVRAVKQGKITLHYNDDDIKEVVMANPDADMKFMNFGNTKWDMVGKLYIDADKDQILYEIKDGKLVKSEAKYDADAHAYVVETKTLGTYILSDTQLKNVTVTTGSTTTTEISKSPETGSHDMIGAAIALAAVSLLAAGAVSIKKK